VVGSFIFFLGFGLGFSSSLSEEDSTFLAFLACFYLGFSSFGAGFCS
jgi:hypothetical protein